MREGYNRVTLAGTLGRDPERKSLPSGTVFLNMRIVTNETYMDKNKQKQERADWHTVELWDSGNRIDALSRFLSKGMDVLVEGSIRYDSWEKDGFRHEKTLIRADKLIVLTKAGGDRSRQEAPPTNNSSRSDDDQVPF